jgi:hypothetical protein
MKRKRGPLKTTAFVELARHRRRTAVRKLQADILKHAAQTGSALFYTHHLLEDPLEPGRAHPWVDVYFLGKDRFTLWNAEFITPQVALHDLAFERAYHEIYEQQGISQGANAAFDALEQALLQTLPLPGERFKTNRKFRHGIGLSAIVQVPTFDVAAIEHTIQRFRDIGEQDWQCPLTHQG